jgi:CRISPR-associated exonuclease Cas4
MVMLVLAALLFVIALLALWLSAKQRSSSGLPAGRVISSDMGGWQKVEKALYDPLSGVTGRPDYLVKEKGFFIPVEVKSTRAPSLPYDSQFLPARSLQLPGRENLREAPSVRHLALPG